MATHLASPRLRHTLTVEAHRERRVPVTIIQAQLGHAHLSTTSVYLNTSARRM